MCDKEIMNTLFEIPNYVYSYFFLQKPKNMKPLINMYSYPFLKPGKESERT